jgi:hypothetical protein
MTVKLTTRMYHNLSLVQRLHWRGHPYNLRPGIMSSNTQGNLLTSFPTHPIGPEFYFHRYYLSNFEFLLPGVGIDWLMRGDFSSSSSLTESQTSSCTLSEEDINMLVSGAMHFESLCSFRLRIVLEVCQVDASGFQERSVRVLF